MRTRLAVLCLLLGVGPARADDAPLRARWSFGLLGGYNQTHSSDERATDVIGLGPGLFTRAGIQWNDSSDLEIDLSAATIALSSFVHAALTYGYTWEWLTVSAGPAFAYHLDIGGAEAAYVAVSVRADFHFWRHVTDSGMRWDFAGSLGGEYGYALSQQTCCRSGTVVPGTSWGVYTSVGPSWY